MIGVNRRVLGGLLAFAVVAVTLIVIVAPNLRSAKQRACDDATTTIDAYRVGRISLAQFDTRMTAAAGRADTASNGVVVAATIRGVKADVDIQVPAGPQQEALATACAG